MAEQEKEEDSGWKIGIGIVIVGIVIIMSVGVFSAVKYGGQQMRHNSLS